MRVGPRGPALLEDFHFREKIFHFDHECIQERVVHARGVGAHVRGFVVKLYTKQGDWDIVGNNIPVFFIQDAIKFPDLIPSAKEEPGPLSVR